MTRHSLTLHTLTRRAAMRAAMRAAAVLAITLGCGGAVLGASPHARDPFQAPPVASRVPGGGAAARGMPGLASAGGVPAMAVTSNAATGPGVGGYAGDGSATGALAGNGSVPVAPAISELQLLAVIYDGAHSLANIGGRIVAVGDAVDDYQVAAIGARSVLLRQGARRVTLTMNQKAPR